MKVSEMFPSNYVASEDLKGREVPVTIESVHLEELESESGPKEKPVVRFAGFGKGLVLNVTNASTIAATYGEETDAWLGKEITLFPTTTQFGKKVVDCIRIRITPEQAQRSMGVAQQQPSTAGVAF